MSSERRREPKPWRGCSNTRVDEGGSRTVDPRLNVITLAVDDLERSLAFYRDGLGLQTKGVVATDVVDEETGAAGAIVIFKLGGGLLLTSSRVPNSPRTR